MATKTLARPRTKPGSVSHTIVTVAGEAVARTGRALTLAEHREAFANTGASMPATYEATFYNLVRRGVLAAVGGRSGHTRYAPVELIDGLSDDESEGADDEAAHVLDALRTVCATYQRAATTREVATVLKARGLVIGGGHPNAVRKRLETLCAERRRGHATWHAPRVRRETVANGLGRPSARWIAVDDPQPVAPDVAATLADTVRELVEVVSAACRRPVAVHELRCWLHAHPAHPLGLVLRAQSFSKLLRAIARVDGLALDAAGGVSDPTARRVANVRAPNGSVGNAGRRYAISGTLAADTPCALLDVVEALAWADEWAEITTAERRASRLDSPALATLALARRAALWQATMTAVPTTVPVAERATWLRTVAATLDASVALVETWMDSARAPVARGEGLHGRTHRIAAQRRHLQALQRALSLGPVDAEAHTATRVAGTAAAVSVPALAPYLTAATREWERPNTARTHTKLLERVRHFHVQRYTPLQAGEAAETPRALVDRAEALATLYRDLPVARASVLITSAMELMGRVVRDVALLEAVRDRSRPALGERVAQPDHPAVWRAAVVALGLMGSAPGEDDVAAAAAMRDTLSVAAVLLAATLVSVDDGRRVITQMSHVGVGHIDVVMAAAPRLERGRLITVVG